MTARFIVRLLDESDALLAWAEVNAEAKPQGRPSASCPFYVDRTTFVISQAGRASKLSIHWADLDIARVISLMEAVDVQVGQVATHTWIEPVWLVSGMRDVPLPPVTVGAPVRVSVPVGSLMATSQG